MVLFKTLVSPAKERQILHTSIIVTWYVPFLFYCCLNRDVKVSVFSVCCMFFFVFVFSYILCPFQSISSFHSIFSMLNFVMNGKVCHGSDFIPVVILKKSYDTCFHFLFCMKWNKYDYWICGWYNFINCIFIYCFLNSFVHSDLAIRCSSWSI